MIPFFVQIKCHLGKSYDVANRLADAEIASEIYSTAGDFDLLVKFYVEEGTDIGHFINEKVQTIPGIQDTRTILTFKAFGALITITSPPADLRRRARALQSELALAPDHEQARRRDDGGADEHQRARQFAEHQVAEHERPQHRGVVERRDQRRLREPIALGQEDVREPAEDADGDERGELRPGRREPAERQRARARRSRR